MGESFITSRGYGYSKITFNIYPVELVRSTATELSEARYNIAATTVGDYALFGGGSITNGYSAVVDAYKSNTGNTSLTVYPGTRYKLWDMQNELTAATMQTLTGSLPLTGYIKVKKANVD